jgi:hypothetical protein
MYLPDAVPSKDASSQYIDEARKFLPKELQKSKVDSMGGLLVNPIDEGPSRKFEKWFDKEMANT